MVEFYLLFFIHIGTRRVIASAPTANPDSAWVAQQARNAYIQVQEQNHTIDYLILDCDTKYTHSFDAVFEAGGAEIIRVGPRAPNLNAHAERWVRSLREECLDHFLICGPRHLDYIVQEYVEHFNLERLHQGVGNVPLPVVAGTEPPGLKFPSGKVKCCSRLGGLLKHYRAAA